MNTHLAWQNVALTGIKHKYLADAATPDWLMDVAASHLDQIGAATGMSSSNCLYIRAEQSGDGL